MKPLISAITRLIEAWGKLGWFSQFTLILFVGIIIGGQIYIIETFKDGGWFVKIFLALLLLGVYLIVYLVFSHSYKIEHKKLLEQSKKQMQKNKDLNT